MKLKTLKDIEKLYDLGGEILIRELDEEGRDRIVTRAKENRKAFLNHLKQEAIKWIKDIDENLKEFENMQGQIVKNEFVDKVQGLLATREWIKHFFNIIEENLK